MKMLIAVLLLCAATVNAAERVTIQGTLVDAKTGAVIEQPVIVQAGKFDPEDPDKPITWGYSESRSSRRDGRFRASVQWSKGWTARVLVDGYAPQPVIQQDPGEVDGAQEVQLRLRPLPEIGGTVLDHLGKPVAGAALYAIGPTGINLHGGQIWTSWGEAAEDAEPVITDGEGRFSGFRVPADGRLAVSSVELDAWPFKIETVGPSVELKLPEPATVKIHYGIEGAPARTEVFYQCLNNHQGDPANVGRWKRLSSDRTFEINTGTTTLSSLPPGRYQMARSMRLSMASIGRSLWLDHVYFEVKPGEVRELDWRRTEGAIAKATFKWPQEVPVEGISYAIIDKDEKREDFGGNPVICRADGGLVDLETKAIRTAALAPGSYQMRIEVQKPISEERLRRSGIIGPDFTMEHDFEVPEGKEEIDLGEIALEGLE